MGKFEPCPMCNPDLRARLDAALTPEQVKRLREAVKPKRKGTRKESSK